MKEKKHAVVHRHCLEINPEHLRNGVVLLNEGRVESVKVLVLVHVEDLTALVRGTVEAVKQKEVVLKEGPKAIPSVLTNLACTICHDRHFSLFSSSACSSKVRMPPFEALHGP